MVVDTIGYNWIGITASSGIFASIFSTAVNLYIRSKDEKERKRKMLYYPLFLGCEGIIEAITEYKDLGETRSKELFITNSKMLDEIVSKHGMIYLEGKNLHEFLQMKKIIDEHLRFFETRNWEFLEEMFESNKFKDLEKNANNLLSICQEEVEGLRNLSGEIECQ